MHAVYIPALQARGVDTSSLIVATLEPSTVSHVAAQYYPHNIDELDVALGALVHKMKDTTKDSQILKTYCIRFLATLSREYVTALLFVYEHAWSLLLLLCIHIVKLVYTLSIIIMMYSVHAIVLFRFIYMTVHDSPTS